MERPERREAPPLPAEALERLSEVDESAIEAFLRRLEAAGVEHEVRGHEPARHARHLASLCGVALHEAARATLFYSDGAAVLGVVPADRKVSAPVLRALLGVADLRVLRGDRGVGRVGWANLPGAAGVLPAVPGLFRASCVVDARLTMDGTPKLVFALDPGRSVRISAADYVRAAGARIERFTGTTRLLPEGGMVDDGT